MFFFVYFLFFSSFPLILYLLLFTPPAGEVFPVPELLM